MVEKKRNNADRKVVSCLPRNRRIAWGLITALVLLTASLATAQTGSYEEPILVSETDYDSLLTHIDRDALERTIRQFAALGSRVTGYPGAEKAAQIVKDAFTEMGLEYEVETFSTLVPMPRPDAAGRPARIRVNGIGDYEIVPMWPNLVRLPKTPPEGISGRLVYAGNGQLTSYNGLDVPGSVVMLDFDSGREWFNAPLLGAQAVLFIEPNETIRGEAEQKFLSMPVDIPRFWVAKQTADLLLGLLKQHENLEVNVFCDMEWEKVTGENIFARIEGSDTRLAKQQVVLQAYYDSISIVPSIAPGAENAANIAILLQLARALKDNPPKRSVTFLATAGHFQAMAGEKAFIAQRMRGARSERRVKRMFELVNTARRELDDAATRVWEEEAAFDDSLPKTEETLAMERIRALGRVGRATNQARKRLGRLEKTIRVAERDDPNRGRLYERQLSNEELLRRREIVADFSDRLDEMRIAVAQLEQAVDAARTLRRNGTTEQRQQALQTVRDAVEQASDALDYSGEDISLWMAVDLSSHYPAFGVFYKGFFYNYNENIQWKFSAIGKRSREYGDIIGRHLSVDPARRIVDGINAIQGRNWRTYMAGKLALSNEVATLAGIPAIGFATINDSRPWVDTPMDLPEYVAVDNLYEQSRFLVCLLADMMSISEPRDFYDLELEDNFVEVKGRLVEFDPEVSTFPDEPIEHAVAVARTGQKTAMGVRCEVFDMAGPDGRVHLLGLPNTRARGGEVPIEGYLLDPDDGRLAMAPDMGVNGNEAYPFKIAMDQDIKPVTCVMFQCESMAIYDMVDQRFFEMLSEIHIYDAAMDAMPYKYGYCLPLPPQPFESTYEPVALVFAPPGTNVKVTMGASMLGLRFVLINPTERNHEGEGYLIDHHRSMYATPYRVARDMWMLNDVRINTLVRHGIENRRVARAHEIAREYLNEAETQLQNLNYDRFLTAARSAWSFESRAYPEVRSTANDVIKGVLFYLAMLMPFAFFAERLLLGSPDIKWQIIGFFAIFMLVFMAIAVVHPAFSITFTPVIILLAFIILALTIIVTSIIVQKFEEQMKQVRFEQTGIRTADVGRLGASAAAFGLGISNLRRRKTRTILTCVTLVLLTFTVLSCTSVVTGVRSNRILLPKTAPYDGVMIRDKTWAPIGEPTARVMRNEFSDAGLYSVAPRTWYFSSVVGEQSFVEIARGDLTYNVTALVGMTPEERDVTQPQDALIDGGRWFETGEKLVCVIPEAMAEKFNITPEDAQSGNVRISVFGVPLNVIGIMDSNRLRRVVDLDGEPITPVDYLVMQEQMQQQQERQSRAGDRFDEEQLREYVHLAPDSTMFVAYDFLLDNGGQLRSVGIGIKDSTLVAAHLDDLMSRVELNIYAGIEGRTFLCSAVSQTGFRNMHELVIPILIAAMICLNTMLGSVYERVREIYIYSSLGLAPTHISALFVAEAAVYAILGAVAGYLFGQVMSKILAETGMLAGLNLNYSSLSAVGSTIIIMLTVMASVAYPARKASDIASPGIERRWHLPEPENDQINMDLPFTVTGDQTLGVNMFLHEYLAAHADYSLGNFSTADLRMDAMENEFGKGYELSLMLWLAPYDLGVSEHLAIQTVPTEDEEVYQIRAIIRRESGDQSSWMRVTRNFINMMRKQYLLWRTFPVGLKEDYQNRGRELFANEQSVDE